MFVVHSKSISMKHFYLLLFILINLSWTSYSQQGISGVVTDPDGLPLGGVNISLKNSNQIGAVTDIDGNFLIKAAQNDTLIFSYIGFKSQEVAVGSKNNFTVTLQVNTESLDQVVVTALGITKAEKKIGYATQEIESHWR